ncbi:MAG: flagellar motor switch protein FliG, partial [Thermodesulfobacteriota bacterium]
VYRAFDKVSATRLLDSVRSSRDQDTFDELNRTDPRVISEFTKAEHPQTTALILAHLEPSVAGKVLSHLPEAARSEVVLRLARIKEVSPTILEEITEALQTDLLNVARGGAEIGGLKKVADILNHADKAVEAEIMNSIQKEDPTLAAAIQQLMFVFDDIVTLDDKAVPEILREIDVKMLAKALRGAGEEVQEKIFKNMSQRAVQVLQEDMEALGPTRLSEVEESQMEIIKVILRLRDEGRVVIHGPGEEDVFV